MLKEEIARAVGPAGADIAYERRGAPEDPVVLLIMGLAAQMVHWPEGFLEALLARRLQIVRFDNRDAGHSTHWSAAPMPDFPAVSAGDLSSVAYTLSDMAADAVGLLDFLGIGKAHLVGASMGGGIAQMIAIEHPDRALSLTSMMMTTGHPAVGRMDPAVQQAIFSGPPATTREQAIERSLRHAPLVRSPAYEISAEAIARTSGLAWDRGHDPVAPARQGLATLASGDRTERLRQLDLPTLVVHGKSDKICDKSGGEATAAAIPGAELALFEGMGHDLPAALWDEIADRIAAVVRRGEARRRAAGS